MLSALNIPREEAEGILVLPDDSVLISIGEEHERFWNLQVSGDRVLRMVFSDVTHPIEKGGKHYNPMNSDQAKVLVKFISQHQDKKFVINCRAGISRSAAVCLFIHQQYGHELKPYFWNLSHPNPLVLQLLWEALRDLSFPSALMVQV